jgi:RNA polymerase sigma-70 factor (ECF subfamily)
MLAPKRHKERKKTFQFQIFDLIVLKEWSAGDVAKSLGVSLASVYLAKHGVSAAWKEEMARIERRCEVRR